jgi:hypothetical protein
MPKKDKGKMLGEGRMLTPKFRIDWPHVCERRPKDAKYNAGKFDCTAIFEIDKTDFSLLDKLVQDAAPVGIKRYKKPLRLGDDERDGDDGYENTKFCTLSAQKYKPTIMRADKTIIDDDDEIIPGAYCRAVISAWSYTKDNNGVALNLHALQYLGGGKRIVHDNDGGANSGLADEAFDESEFEDVEDSDYDDGDDEFGYDDLGDN